MSRREEEKIRTTGVGSQCPSPVVRALAGLRTLRRSADGPSVSGPSVAGPSVAGPSVAGPSVPVTKGACHRVAVTESPGMTAAETRWLTRGGSHAGATADAVCQAIVRHSRRMVQAARSNLPPR